MSHSISMRREKLVLPSRGAHRAVPAWAVVPYRVKDHVKVQTACQKKVEGFLAFCHIWQTGVTGFLRDHFPLFRAPGGLCKTKNHSSLESDDDHPGYAPALLLEAHGDDAQRTH